MTAIAEYMDTEQMAAYAGSISNGEIDTEYTHLRMPQPPYRVHPPLGDVVAEQGKEIAKLRREVAHLSRLLHKAINCPHCIDDYGNEVGTPPPLTITERFQWQAERTELDELRAFKASVPWDALTVIVTDFVDGGVRAEQLSQAHDALESFFARNYPGEQVSA